MNKLVCCTSVHSVGCTFMDWSLHFLSGNDQYPRLDGELIELSKNPLETINAHSHKKNHPKGASATKSAMDVLMQRNGLTSLYPVPYDLLTARKALALEQQQLSEDNINEITQYRVRDYNTLLKNLSAVGAKIIFVNSSENFSIYSQTLRECLTDNNGDLITKEMLDQETDKMFFNDSLDIWTDCNLTNVWDIRERRALSSRPFRVLNLNVDLTVDHYYIDCQNWWFDGSNQILKIMQWAEIEVDHSRYVAWEPIYRKWQSIIIQQLQFQWNYQHIVNSIVHGWSMPIDLTFDQEVIIQHCLIYHHNLNLKTWQLEKFPANTKDLHELLETNIHPLREDV